MDCIAPKSTFFPSLSTRESIGHILILLLSVRINEKKNVLFRKERQCTPQVQKEVTLKLTIRRRERDDRGVVP